MPRISIRGAAAAVAAVGTTGLLLGATDNASELPGPADADRAATAPAGTGTPSIRPRAFGPAGRSAVDWRVGATRAYAAERPPSAARASRGAARVALTGNPKAVARGLAATRGWDGAQFACLESLWQKESGWNQRRANPSSGAYGIPQALPRIEDGDARRGLAHQPRDPDPLGS